MTFDPTVRAAIIGCGAAGRSRIRSILAGFDNTSIEVVCEPSPDAYAEAAAIFEEAGRPAPPNVPDLDRLLGEHAHGLDAVFVVTPHAMHFSQAKACLEAGLDVLLEKPMVMNVQEALELIEARDRAGRTLVVSFQGSLSPHIRKAVEMLRSGELGHVQTISGVIWQNWGGDFRDGWRWDPMVSGGGFMFDSGAHMLNTVSDLAGEDFTDVWALFENDGAPVDINAAIMGRLESGILVTIHAAGQTAPSCASDIRVFCTRAALRTGAWGESLEILHAQPPNWQETGISRDQGWEIVPVRESRGVWEEFLSAREGRIVNPSPAELGLRMAHLWDAIRESAARDGEPVRLKKRQVSANQENRNA